MTVLPFIRRYGGLLKKILCGMSARLRGETRRHCFRMAARFTVTRQNQRLLEDCRLFGPLRENRGGPLISFDLYLYYEAVKTNITYK